MTDRTPDPLYLGIDGGATGCRARLADGAGRVLAEATGGPANPRHGLEAACGHLVEVARRTLAAAFLPDPVLGRLRAGLGLAGVGQPADRARLLAWDHPFAGLALATDAEAACLGAHAGGDGAVLVLGTGSCGMARVGGRWHRVGGWGFPVSDPASGAWLGLEAIRLALAAHDGLAGPGPLAGAVLARFGGAPEAVVGWLDGAGPRDYAGLAPLVLDHAAAGDGAAVDLVRRAAADAAAMLAALRATGAPRLALLGGLAGPLGPWLPEAARRSLDAPLGDALDGALRLAREAPA